MATSVTPGKLSMDDFREAVRRMPGAMWVSLADGWDRALRGFWKPFAASLNIKRTGYRFTLTSPRAWPIEITDQPLPSYASPNFDLFRARFGTHSEAAHGLEVGGTIAPSRSRWMAIPIRGARSRSTGRVLPGYATPAKARSKRGKRFVSQKTANPGVILLFELVKPKRGRGRPRKGGKKRNPNRLVASGVPAFMLVRTIKQDGDRLHLERSFAADMGNAERRLAENLTKAIREVLAGRIPKPRARGRRFA